MRIQFKCGKIRTRKNSVFGHFSRSVCHYSESNDLHDWHAFFVVFVFFICLLIYLFYFYFIEWIKNGKYELSKLPSEHLLVLKTSSTRLERNNFTSSKTSWRRLEEVLEMFWRHLEDIFKTSWRRLEDVLKTSWRLLEDI